MQIVKRDASEFTAGRRAAICNCEVPCKVFVSYIGDEMLTVCETGAKVVAFDTLELLGVMKESWTHMSKLGEWTTKQEEEIIQYIKANGIKYGTYRLLGERFGKTRDQVKHKVQHMRKVGRLPSAQKKNL